MNERGDIDESRRHTIFAFRDYDYTGYLADFSRWGAFRETDTDRQYKAQIEEEIGIKLGPWTIVSFVGRQGIFYDFSPEVVKAILDRMRARFKQLEEAKARQAGGLANVVKPKKGDRVETKPVTTNQTQPPVVVE
ncbi:unnamed protein product [Rhizoctonia solani]|uniref:Uncharacterized protein n=1 Tax=Rhizoctonia solani TaxID=456999 RepID=A0A8H3ARX3_9AGAM|nr:unnamed protein product [Rhizoctonia solani]